MKSEQEQWKANESDKTMKSEQEQWKAKGNDEKRTKVIILSPAQSPSSYTFNANVF